jgi:hypothetical protein
LDAADLVYADFYPRSRLEPLPFARDGMGKCVCHVGKCYVFVAGVSTFTTAPGTSNKVTMSRTVYRVYVYDIESDSLSLDTVWQQTLADVHCLVTKRRSNMALMQQERASTPLCEKVVTLTFTTPRVFDTCSLLSCSGFNVTVSRAGHADRASGFLPSEEWRRRIPDRRSRNGRNLAVHLTLQIQVSAAIADAAVSAPKIYVHQQTLKRSRVL